MNFFGLGIMAGVFVGVVIWIAVKTARQGKNEVQFDERQMAARNEAYQIGFFSLLILLCIDASLQMLEFNWCERPLGEFVCMLISIGVFVNRAIAKDAYEGITKEGKSQVVLFGILAATQLLSGLNYLLDGRLMENGMLTLECIQPLSGILFAYAVIHMYIHKRNARKAEAEEE